MPQLQKITIKANLDDLENLKKIAIKKRTSYNSLIRQAIAEFIQGEMENYTFEWQNGDRNKASFVTENDMLNYIKKREKTSGVSLKSVQHEEGAFLTT